MQSLRKHEKLNQVEEWKLARHPLDVRDAIIERYSIEGAQSIQSVEGEMERLKRVGLYPQRQGGDAFMLRIKVPGGQLTAPQAAVIGQIADEFARIPEPNPACGDSARNVLCCPVSGIDREDVAHAYPVATAISNFFTGNREYANLPRKF